MYMNEHPKTLGAIGYLAERSKPADTTGFFAISSARPIDKAFGVCTDTARGRCDAGAYGPYGFHEWDAVAGVCNCGLTEMPDPAMGHHVLTMAAVSFVTVVASALPYGYILYFEVNDPQVQEQALTMRHSDCALTLQELLRLMWEWEQAYTVFGNRESIAVACHNMWLTWAPPMSVSTWVTNRVPEQKVARYIRNDVTARGRTPGIPELALDMDEWVCDLMLHASALGDVRHLE